MAGEPWDGESKTSESRSSVVKSNDTKTYPNSLRFYRAKKDGNGSAISFNLKLADENRRGVVFLKIASQTDGTNPKTARFGWEDGLLIALNSVEVAGMVGVLNDWYKTLNGENGIYHTGQGDPKGLRMMRDDNNTNVSFWMKSGDQKVSIAISAHSECILLSNWLTRTLERLEPV